MHALSINKKGNRSSRILIVLLTMVYLPMTVSAATTNWQDSGVLDTSWYSDSSSAFTIRAPAELAGLAYLVNNEFKTFLGKTVILGANIDLGGRDWIPIAENYFFSGTFDGAGHSISGLAIGSSDSRNSTLSVVGNLSYWAGVRLLLAWMI